MRIAFIVGGFPTLSETFILNQITGLIDLGHHVDIFAGENPRQELTHSEIIQYDLLRKTRYFEPLTNKFAKIFVFFYTILRILFESPKVFFKALIVFGYCRRKLSINIFYPLLVFLKSIPYDIIHCHYGLSGSLAVVLRDLGVLSGKIITTFHGCDIRAGISKGPDIYAELFTKTDLILSISSYNYKNLVKFGVNPRKISYHPVGIDMAQFSIRDKPGKRDGITILTVARLAEVKGLKYGIEAVYKLMKKRNNLHCKYYIIGEGTLRKDLELLINDFKLNERVFLLGAMSRDGVIRHMEDADIFILPSVNEALPVVLMEAQAAGLPVVATKVGSVDEVVKDGETGFLVPACDSDVIAERLEYLIEHPDLWLEMGRQGRKLIEEKYDIKKLNHKLVEIFQRLIEN